MTSGSAFLLPSLTSVDVNLERIGSNAMARLIARLRDEPCRRDPTAHQQRGLARVNWARPSLSSAARTRAEKSSPASFAC